MTKDIENGKYKSIYRKRCHPECKSGRCYYESAGKSCRRTPEKDDRSDQGRGQFQCKGLSEAAGCRQEIHDQHKKGDKGLCGSFEQS